MHRNGEWCYRVIGGVLPIERIGGLCGRLAEVLGQASGLSVRCRVVGWLLVFVAIYRLGMPILYSAALAALPWLLLPLPEKGTD